MTVSWVAPDACTLPTAEQPLRVAEFDRLFSRYLVRVDRHGPTRAELVFAGPAGLAGEIRGLAERETSCCSFFDFTVSPQATRADGDAVRLEVEVPPARADVLAGLAARAESARGGGRDGN